MFQSISNNVTEENAIAILDSKIIRLLARITINYFSMREKEKVASLFAFICLLICFYLSPRLLVFLIASKI